MVLRSCSNLSISCTAVYCPRNGWLKDPVDLALFVVPCRGFGLLLGRSRTVRNIFLVDKAMKSVMKSMSKPSSLRARTTMTVGEPMSATVSALVAHMLLSPSNVILMHLTGASCPEPGVGRPQPLRLVLDGGARHSRLLPPKSVPSHIATLFFAAPVSGGPFSSTFPGSEPACGL